MIKEKLLIKIILTKKTKKKVISEKNETKQKNNINKDEKEVILNRKEIKVKKFK
jgi:hypothetical protein